MMRPANDDEIYEEEIRLNEVQIAEVCWDACLWARDGFGLPFDPQQIPMVIAPHYFEGETIAVLFYELVRNVVQAVLDSEEKQTTFPEAGEALAAFGFFQKYQILPDYAEAAACEFLLRLCFNLLNWDSSEGIGVLERMAAMAREWVPAACNVMPAETSNYEPLRREYDCSYHLSYTGENA